MKERKIPEMKPLFKERMEELLEEQDFQNYLEILKVQPVKSIRCNKLKFSPERLRERLESKGWKINQPWENHPEVMIVEGKFPSHMSSQSNIEIINEGKNTECDRCVNREKTKIVNSKEFMPLRNKVSNEKNHSGLIDKNAEQLGNSCCEAGINELEPGELGRGIEHLLGYYYIQELASMLPVIALSPKKGERVLDLCSAPGSKTTQISAEMKNSGVLIANEVSLGRLRILASNLERCGVANTILTKKDGIALCKRFEKEGMKFDKILVDAPCSGEGTLRSSYRTYEMWNPKTIISLSRLQKALVSEAIKILAPGGTIVYSTCTHAPEENEEVVDFVLRNFPEIEIQNLELPVKTRPGISKWKNKKFLEKVKKSCRVYPHDNNTEGFFITKFMRRE